MFSHEGRLLCSNLHIDFGCRCNVQKINVTVYLLLTYECNGHRMLGRTTVCTFRERRAWATSVMFLCHSRRRMGAESSAERMARQELKLLIFRRCFIILMNLTTILSRSLASFCFRIQDRALHNTSHLAATISISYSAVCQQLQLSKNVTGICKYSRLGSSAVWYRVDQQTFRGASAGYNFTGSPRAKVRSFIAYPTFKLSMFLAVHTATPHLLKLNSNFLINRKSGTGDN